MSETNDWTARVDQMTAATTHEHLRSALRDAETTLEKFTGTAYEQGGLLLDAQREMEAAVERKLAEMSAQMTAALDAIRKDIASIAESLTARPTPMAVAPSVASTAIAS